MDKTQFCDEVDRKLSELQQQLQAETFAAPATLEMSEQQEKRRPLIEEASRRAGELRDRLDTIRAAPAPLSGADRADIERMWGEIARSLASPTES